VAVLRKPAVAGRFYPADSTTLQSQIAGFLSFPETKIKARGIMVPHAGYVYSGHVAGAVFSKVELPKRMIILCPNHKGLGPPLSILSSGEWEIPLGKVQIDTDLARRLMHHCHLLTENADAHKHEHSLEVQLPFLYYLMKDFKFVPIAIGTSGYAVVEHLGMAIANTLKEIDEEILLIASSDMNHYESDDITRVKDMKAIEKILALDPKGLYEVIKAESISMCGYGPAIAMLYGTEFQEPRQAELIKYATSGDVSGDKREVVGYAGIAVYQPSISQPIH
jgi:AmmeMemoRadiSam system protein B